MYGVESPRARAWVARGERLITDPDCAEHGYLAMVTGEQVLRRGDVEAALQMAREAVELGERCGDADLVAGARHQQGRAAIKLGIGRYLYRLPRQWVDYDPQTRQFKQTPALPVWALPATKQSA